MTEYESSIEKLMSDGYDEILVRQLPRLYVQDSFIKEREILSVALDEVIQYVQSGEITCKKRDNMIRIAGIDRENFVWNPQVIGKPEEYSDLCRVYVCNVDNGWCYIKENDLYDLLAEKGLPDESIEIIFGEYGFGRSFPNKVRDEGIYIDQDVIMNLKDSNKRLIK